MSLKDKISNWLAVVAFAVGGVQVVLQVWNDYIAANPDPTVAINWPILVSSLIVGLISWMTGKTGTLKGSAQ